MMLHFEELLAPVTELVRSMRPLLYDPSTAAKITAKGDSDFVTEADLTVQRRLEEGLRALSPDFAYMGEESASHAVDPERPTWIIDPIDGTTNFIHGFGLSAVSVGLVLGGRSVLGVVFNPYMDELFAAVQGRGATMNGNPISVSRQSDFHHALVGIGTMPYNKERTADSFILWRKLFCAGVDIRRIGSSALDVCYVAMGRMDVFAEPSLGSWDFAASGLILHEAGGRLTDWFGRELCCDGAHHSVAASNGILHDGLLAMIADAGAPGV